MGLTAGSGLRISKTDGADCNTVCSLLTLVTALDTQMRAGGAEALVRCRLGAIAALHAQSPHKDTLTIVRIDTHALQHYK